jgi:hypothetical protein
MNQFSGSLLRKGMEQLIEFLQIELEKDFGYHDDQAINALQQSVQELRYSSVTYIKINLIFSK